MATQDQINDLAALYAGYFNRAADPAGLQFWIDQIDGGREFSTIAADFAASPEAEALYPYLTTPGVSSPGVFITSIYMNLFNRVPDAAGLAFWSGVLADGTVAVGDFIAAVINGATNDPAEGTFDLATLDNKIEVSLAFADATSNIPGFTYDAAAAGAAVAVLDGVTYDPATVAEGKLEVVDFVSQQGFTLTTGVDILAGGDSNTVFNAPISIGIDGITGVQTLQGQDVINGGEGHNVLNAELNGTGTTSNPTISNVQVYNLTAFQGYGELDLSRATGYEELWDRNSRANLDVYNVGEVATLGLDNVSGGSTFWVGYDNIAVETQVVVANHSGAAGNSVDLDIYGVMGDIGTLELNVSNGAYLYLDSDGSDTENLTIAGSGTLQLEGANNFRNLQTLDTLGYDGDVNLNISGGGNVVSVLTGVGDDRIVVDDSSVNGGLVVDLGAGENTLAVYNAYYYGVSDLDFTGGVQNVQTLELTSSINLYYGDTTLDLDGFDDALKTVQFDGGVNGDGNTFGFANAPEVLTANVAYDFQDVNLGTGNIVDLTMNVAGYYLTLDSVDGADLVNLTLNQSHMYNAVDYDGYVNLDIYGSDDVASLQNVTMSGTGDVNAHLYANNVNDDINALTTVSLTAGGTTGDHAYLYMDGYGDVGFKALDTVDVHAVGYAEAIIDNASGAFTLDVSSATDDAYAYLYNTGVSSATVAAGMGVGDTAVVSIYGNTTPANDHLTSLTVSGHDASVYLADNLEHFTTLDVSGVSTYLSADTSGATFFVGSSFVNYLIGATSDGDNATTDVNFYGNTATHEVYDFVGADIGNVVIDNFTWGNGPTGDRLDLSSFASSAADLVFTDTGSDTVVTDVSGFHGSVTIVGLTGVADVADLATFNIIYA